MTLSLRTRALFGRPGARWVTPEDLNVAPALLGMPLARPSRRLWAMGVDLAAIGTISSFSNFWLLAAVCLPMAEQARARRTGPSLVRGGAAWILAALMAWAGVQEVIATLRGNAPARTAPAAAAATDDDVMSEEDAAAIAAAASSIAAAASSASPRIASLAASVAAVAAASAPGGAASDAATVAALTARVHALEAKLRHERAAAEDKLNSQDWHERLRRLGLDFGVGYGWALVYFSLLPAWWRGQTLGKRLFGLRAVEIAGKPMTPLISFKRFGGYLAGMATGGLGLVQLLWDPNRQALQDKAAHTVVVDERAARLPEPAGPQAQVQAQG